MKLYRTGDRVQVKWHPWHIINPETLFAYCGDDPRNVGEHFDGIDGEVPAGDRLCVACEHAKAGYQVVNVQYGQVRRYGPSIYCWHVTDLTGTKTVEEVKAYCLEHVRKVPVSGDSDYHPLHEHFQRFSDRGNHVFEYQTGHEYTG